MSTAHGNDTTRIEIRIHPDRCIAAGHCVVAAAEVFSQNDTDGVVILIDAHPPADLHARVREAAHKCPTGAIELIEGG